ncbi:hypothetical protein HDU93_008287 [Gonapodya sp. JEL0774]|nr:hypothetical protein HDU93_008287 [Gonapodya sp. JEL0774]
MAAKKAAARAKMFNSGLKDLFNSFVSQSNDKHCDKQRQRALIKITRGVGSGHGLPTSFWNAMLEVANEQSALLNTKSLDQLIVLANSLVDDMKSNPSVLDSHNVAGVFKYFATHRDLKRDILEGFERLATDAQEEINYMLAPRPDVKEIFSNITRCGFCFADTDIGTIDVQAKEAPSITNVSLFVNQQIEQNGKKVFLRKATFRDLHRKAEEAANADWDAFHNTTTFTPVSGPTSLDTAQLPITSGAALPISSQLADTLPIPAPAAISSSSSYASAWSSIVQGSSSSDPNPIVGSNPLHSVGIQQSINVFGFHSPSPPTAVAQPQVSQTSINIPVSSAAAAPVDQAFSTSVYDPIIPPATTLQNMLWPPRRRDALAEPSERLYIDSEERESRKHHEKEKKQAAIRLKFAKAPFLRTDFHFRIIKNQGPVVEGKPQGQTLSSSSASASAPTLKSDDDIGWTLVPLLTLYADIIPSSSVTTNALVSLSSTEAEIPEHLSAKCVTLSAISICQAGVNVLGATSLA